MADDDELPEFPDPDFEDWEPHGTLPEETEWLRLDQLKEARHNNTLAIHKTVKWLIPLALCLAFSGFATLTIVYVLHLILPETRRWLKPDEIEHIHSLIFSSAAGGGVALMARTYLGGSRKE